MAPAFLEHLLCARLSGILFILLESLKVPPIERETEAERQRNRKRQRDRDRDRKRQKERDRERDCKGLAYLVVESGLVGLKSAGQAVQEDKQAVADAPVLSAGGISSCFGKSQFCP